MNKIRKTVRCSRNAGTIKTLSVTGLFAGVLLCMQVGDAQPPGHYSNSRKETAADTIQTGPLIRLDHTFAFTEGPVSDLAGNIYFTDQPNNAIWEYDTGGKFSRLILPSGLVTVTPLPLRYRWPS